MNTGFMIVDNGQPYPIDVADDIMPEQNIEGPFPVFKSVEDAAEVLCQINGILVDGLPSGAIVEVSLSLAAGPPKMTTAEMLEEFGLGEDE